MQNQLFSTSSYSLENSYPFGMVMPGRSFTSSGGDYRFGFNGMEKDNEGMGGGGSTLDYGFRIYNAQIGKFLSVDPLFKSYPWYTPYQFAGNKPIVAIDLDGLEEFIIHHTYYETSEGEPFLYMVNYKEIPEYKRHPNFKEDGTYIDDNQNPGTFNLDNYHSVPESYIQDGNGVEEYDWADYGSSSNKNDMKLVKSSKLTFSNDGGMNVSDVVNQFNSLDKASQREIDIIVSALVNDENSVLYINGVASPKATNLNRESEDLSKDNNLILAERRANATEEFIKNYAIEKFGKEIKGEIVKTSEVRDSEGSGNSDKDRVVEIKLNSNE